MLLLHLTNNYIPRFSPHGLQLRFSICQQARPMLSRQPSILLTQTSRWICTAPQRLLQPRQQRLQSWQVCVHCELQAL
jgi:hypothetical protein